MAKISAKVLYQSLVLLVLSFGGNICFAQIEIKGKVTDKINNPIQSVTVTLIDKSQKLVLEYDITDKEGTFNLRLERKPQSILWLHFNAIGFIQDSIELTNQFTGLSITLTPITRILPPVTVKNRKSFLTIKPDTTNYETLNFAQKQDRTIEDVLKKIPGIEIDGTGKILFNGRAISNFYIDGDDIVSDRYTIATKAITPEMVEKIQLIENHNPIKVLESAVLSTKTALNLSLKDDARLALMGNSEIGLGNRSTYNISANLLSFKKHFKFINQLKTNNAGVDISKDITPHNLDNLLKKLEQNSSKPFLGVSEIGNPELQKQRYLFNRTGLLTLNNSFSVKPETQMKLNIHYLQDIQNITANSLSVFTLPTASFSYDEQKQQEKKIKNLHMQFTITENKNKYYFNNVVSFNSATPLFKAITKLNGIGSTQEYSGLDWDVSDELSIIKKNKNKGISEVNSYIRYQSSSEDLNMLPGLNDSIFNKGTPYSKLTQSVKLNTLFTNQNYSYKVVNSFLLQTYKVGFITQIQTMNSDIKVTENSGLIMTMNDSFKNKFDWNQYKAYIQANYDIINNKSRFSLSLPLFFHNIKKNTEVGVNSINFTKLIFSPSFRWRYDLKSEQNINLFYQFNETPTTIQENYSNYILTNFMTLQAWKTPIVTRSSHSANAGWIGQKSVQLLTTYVNVGLNLGVNRFLSRFSYFNTIQINDYVEGNVNLNSFYLNTGVSKYIFSMRTTLSGKFSLQQNNFEQVQQGRLTQFSDLQQTVSAKAQYRISTWLSGFYNIAYTQSTSENKSQLNTPKQKTSFVMHQLEVNTFPTNNLSIRLIGENYQAHRNKNKLVGAFFIDVQVAYKIKKYKTELLLDGINLNGNNEYSNVTVSGNQTSQVTFPLRRSTLMATIRVHF
ncbi:MAG: carboxypeptidase-like regulatory domain-containing protein [Rickettsiaceae bacterium]|nr:carboxypeptidase-like regulatory domain-containing protein [Rickettsiaceae bacterium]